jgi:hypothetical protein
MKDPASDLRALLAELHRGGLELEDLVAAKDPERDRPADHVAQHEPLQVAGVVEGLSVHVEDHVLDVEAGPGGRAALDHLGHADP